MEESAIAPPVTAWSFSRLLDFEQCPYRVYLSHVMKLERPPEDPDSPLVRGTRIHTDAENYITGIGELTKELDKPKILEHLDYVKGKIAVGQGTCEEDWGFDSSWAPTGWTAEDIWLRMKLDVATEMEDDGMLLTDWKTGKSFNKQVRTMQQAQLYATGAFMRYPELQYVQPVFAYIDENYLHELKAIYRKDIPRYIKRFTDRATKMTLCTDFRAKPNVMNCKWCDFGPNGTEACAHGVKA